MKWIAIGASAGGLGVLKTVTASLPRDLPAALLIVSHIGRHESHLPALLARRAAMPAVHPADGDVIEPGHIYVAPSDHHMLVEGHTLRITRGAKEHHTRPAIDPLFRTLAFAHGLDAIGVVLSGMLDDGTAGLQDIKRCGGTAVVQEPTDAEHPSMPMSAMRHVQVDHRARGSELAELLKRLASAPSTPTRRPEPSTTLRQEVALTLEAGDPIERLREVGAPSGYVCPDCHGSLWRVSGAEPPRYRCHTGHAFSALTLADTLSNASQEALWNALRAVQEQSLLLHDLAAQQRNGAPSPSADALDDAARRLEQQTQTLRQMVERAP